MITATSTVKGTANAQPKWVWHPSARPKQVWRPSARLKSVWHPKCATFLIGANSCLDRPTGEFFGLDSLIRSGLVVQLILGSPTRHIPINLLILS